MSWMTGLNAIVLSLWLVWTTSFSHCLYGNWWLGLLALRLSQLGTLTGWRLPTLRVLIFSQRCVNAC